MLRGVALDEPVTDVMNRKPVTVGRGLGATRRSPSCTGAGCVTSRWSTRADAVVELLLDDLLRPAALPNAAVIMAGGEGSRMRPLTEARPSRCSASAASP